MYSQNCNYMSSKSQPPLIGSFPHSLGLLRNLTSKSFPNFEESSSHIDFDTTGQEHLPSRTTNIMDLMYSLGNSPTSLKNPISNTQMQKERSRHNCKDLIAHYNSISTMPLISSHLVGGFVGSKSQLGRRPTKGFGLKMWDIIRELIDLVGTTPSNVSVKENSNRPLLDSKLCNTYKSSEKEPYNMDECDSNVGLNNSEKRHIESCPKQSYADVAKSKLTEPTLEENTSDNIIQQHTQHKSYCIEDFKLCKPMIEPLSCSNECYLTNRDRITSECSADSEDSFIVFEYCEENDGGYFDDSSSDSDDESTQSLQAHDESSSECGSAVSRTCSLNESTHQPIKKVRFAEGKSLAHVHPMIAWNYAYRTARRGPWEMLARDSERFRCRIAKTEPILKPVLDPQHRQKVFQQRFIDS